ncbi:NuoF family protein [Desulfotalea psychrophila]|uniref:Probable NADH dehydrogenase (Ubiquinone) I, chain F n=1 Tax=Desulfotalea psychrophila (strain LSv54 / DSM 12343) TaxID=177439 RepID=Q6AL37_DESPS|nr:NuoF family protein [Desulfotalea psychrophila]CAG36938.1 probable NADH dehydrogenase (ubiquinone) I, chain F [Desulfotalea psychrophila LSv54]
MTLTLEDLNHIAAIEKEHQHSFQHQLNICVAAGCLSCGSGELKTALQEEVARRGLDKQVCVKGVGCLGLCSAGPLVALASKNVLYQGCGPADVETILDALGGAPAKHLLCSSDIPFFNKQRKVVLEYCGKIDPERIEEYIAVGGYQSLYTALRQMTPKEVIDEVTASGLRGRGGAGYPTGLKWSTVSKAINAVKYVVCNADEGDPGAFMDRSVLESDPHRVIEGMAIGAYAVGARQGIIYVRAEYPLAVKRLQKAITQAKRIGILGNGIFNSDFQFDIQIRLGAGAFVCGEETALIASIEGRVGKPCPRPPYPAESGLKQCPTLINNVETFANIAPIIRNGGQWLASIGTSKSKGTKVFALAGKVQQKGLIEVAMGTTLGEIVFDIGGGIADGGTFKAVQTGGPSGGCIPKQFLDMGVDYESLAKVGSIMGSGGMIVMDQGSCMVDVARFFVEFCMSESCGKCVPCRVGTRQMHDVLGKIASGRGEASDLTLLEELCDLVKNTALCGLGQASVNPILSTLCYFKDEYLAHIEEKRCIAHSCTLPVNKEGK